jgi:secondary thiamine-phosphate synthase enzyme
MAVYYEEIKLTTKGENDIIDLTKNIQDIATKSRITNGIICAFIPGSTATITTMEYEPGLKKDIPQALDKIAPKSLPYEHHNTWHDTNGRSHVKASIMGPGLTLPITNGKVVRGTWQQIVFMEFDVQPRQRKIVLQIIGE